MQATHQLNASGFNTPFPNLLPSALPSPKGIKNRKTRTEKEKQNKCSTKMQILVYACVSPPHTPTYPPTHSHACTQTPTPIHTHTYRDERLQEHFRCNILLLARKQNLRTSATHKERHDKIQTIDLLTLTPMKSRI